VQLEALSEECRSTNIAQVLLRALIKRSVLLLPTVTVCALVFCAHQQPGTTRKLVGGYAVPCTDNPLAFLCVPYASLCACVCHTVQVSRSSSLLVRIANPGRETLEIDVADVLQSVAAGLDLDISQVGMVPRYGP
jgi:hypothetical protein